MARLISYRAGGLYGRLTQTTLELLSFHRGVHPGEEKHLTALKNGERMPLPDHVYLPLSQHIGAPCTSLVAPGDTVKTGQVIARSDAFLSSPIHATVTGVVKGIEMIPHPSGKKQPAIHIQRTGDDEWELLDIANDPAGLSPEAIRNLIREAGIVGLGGAGFPSHVKLSPPPSQKIDSFILNGCECEPYLTSDHRMMAEMTKKIFRGMELITRVLGVENVSIGIENNKPDAIRALKDGIKQYASNAKLVFMKPKYPQGAEKMLISTVLGRVVPEGKLPGDVGVVVSNIGTVIAIAEAVYERKPLIERIVSITGNGIVSPKNVYVRIGTPFKEVLAYCGGLKSDATKVIMGGPMMGHTQHDLSVPVVKTTGGILCMQKEAVAQGKTEACIRCGACVGACPMQLLPTKLARFTEMGRYDEAEKLGLMSCIECGSCAFVCPSHIPIVQWIRAGKYTVRRLAQKKIAS